MHNRVTNSKRWFGDNRLGPLTGAGITEVDVVSPFVTSFIVRPPCAMCLIHRLNSRDSSAL